MKARLFFILSLIVLPIINALAMTSHKAMHQESTGQYVDSSIITLKVKSKLLTDSNTKDLKNISVMSYKGKVTLTGHVATQAQKEMVGHLTKKVEGVTGVTNNLVVAKPKK